MKKRIKLGTILIISLLSIGLLTNTTMGAKKKRKATHEGLSFLFVKDKYALNRNRIREAKIVKIPGSRYAVRMYLTKSATENLKRLSRLKWLD